MGVRGSSRAAAGRPILAVLLSLAILGTVMLGPSVSPREASAEESTPPP